MFQFQFIGTLGADAEKKVAKDTGRKFVTFRAAHNDVWKDESGQEHTDTTWVDCIIDDHPAVTDYLKRGTQIYCSGHRLPALRVYSSPKDRCMKAGMTLKVSRIELIGGRVDPVPRELITEGGAIVPVTKYYHVDGVKKATQMLDRHGNVFDIDKNGWVTGGHPSEEQAQEVSDGTTTQQ